MAKSVVVTSPCPVLLLTLSLIFGLCEPAGVFYNVVSYGAKPDGRTDSTSAFLKAWGVACSSATPATVYVPQGGSFLLRSVEFSGPCRSRVTFWNGGTLLAPYDYWSLGDLNYWIMFIHVNGVSVIGGTLNAQGAGYWSCLASQKSCPVQAVSLAFQWSNNVLVSGITSLNSRWFHISFNNCVGATVRNVKISAPSQSPITDGIHIQASTGISVITSKIMTGDDCISLGPGSRNVFIKRIACGPGHGISIGSLGRTANEDGVENVTVTGVVFTGTQNGVRIKSWARPSNGFARSIAFRNIVMRNVDNPIIIDQKYCPNNKGCPTQNSGIQISRVSYENIRGTSATPVAISLYCSPTHPCRGISLQNINLTHPGQQATSYCANAGGNSAGVVIPKSCL